MCGDNSTLAEYAGLAMHIRHTCAIAHLTFDMEGLGLGFVANHFDVVPVRTKDESHIVVRVIIRAQTRRTIVFATRLQSRAIESFDLLAILGRERQVKMRRLLLGLVRAQ